MIYWHTYCYIYSIDAFITDTALRYFMQYSVSNYALFICIAIAALIHRSLDIFGVNWINLIRLKLIISGMMRCKNQRMQIARSCSWHPRWLMHNSPSTILRRPQWLMTRARKSELNSFSLSFLFSWNFALMGLVLMHHQKHLQIAEYFDVCLISLSSFRKQLIAILTRIIGDLCFLIFPCLTVFI